MWISNYPAPAAIGLGRPSAASSSSIVRPRVFDPDHQIGDEREHVPDREIVEAGDGWRARDRKSGSQQTHRWRGESRANQSLKVGFSARGNYGPIPKRLWMMSEV